MRHNNLNKMIKISLLSVMAFILMFFEVSMPIFPNFLKIDISDLPALLGSFALGPIEGVGIELFKNILHVIFKGTQTGLVGEFANFTVGAVLVLVAGYIYRCKKSKKTAVLGLLTGSIIMSIVASVLNYSVFLPLFAKAFKMPIDAFVSMGALVNPKIHDLKGLVMWSILPFNLLKGLIVSSITLVMYKSVSPILHKDEVVQKRKINALEDQR
ncbi:ECF transporter S component [Clostridium botulinum]|uniref:ECF transporter S component n=1 Tax=Clostridium botulinum TaxID=1491 RepID=UPI0004D8D605|nr:ECF transporter S component [Clostridium botulinum]KEI00279.1 membrane protein [Clostridium botulinum C/D str. BKT75002]KEI08900.1 membrane protein [Clostridium botulinum C/D str. BKT2873]QPW60949.1 ECF transporter S component [Clostridium botulinum]